MERIPKSILILFALAMVCAVARGADLPNLNDSPTRARVVVVKNPRATAAFEPRQDIVNNMVESGIRALAGEKTSAQAWRNYVTTQDVIGIKVYSGPGANSGTRPAVARAVIEGLLAAGMAPSKIIIWDRRLSDLRIAGFESLARQFHIRIAGSFDSGYDGDAFYDNAISGSLIAGDYEFDHSGAKFGRKSYVSKLLTKEITKIITISPLLNHNLAGICGNLFSLALGSVDNTMRFQSDPARLATAVPEIYALPALSDHVSLCILDALIGQYQGEQMSLLHYSAEVNQIWFSKDPVALDVLGIQELDRERQAANMRTFGANPDLYSNAALLELGVASLSKIRLDVVKTE